MERSRLRYRRQFLLCRDRVSELSDWNCRATDNGLYLYSHPDLETANAELDGVKIHLLGYIFDSVCPEKNNQVILTDIVQKSQTFSSLLDAIGVYSGQYVLLYINGSTAKVIHDPLALREVYYCTAFNKVVCGSQPNLLNEFSRPALGVTADMEIRRFHGHDLPRSRSGRFWVGDETYFANIKHLLPNHYFDANSLCVERYWPRKPLVMLDLDEAVRRAGSFLRGALDAAARRHNLMMAVTSGIDSRTLLAASKGISDTIYYFINKNRGLEADHPDIRIPSAIFKRIGLPFHIHDPQGEIDPDFREIFLHNTFMSTELNLPATYHVYFKNHSHRMNILGVGEIGRTFYGDAPRNPDGFFLARSMKFKKSRYAIEQCQKWVNSTLPIATRLGINTMTLLLWEQLLGNWGAVGNSESDIAIDEYDPFNSHYLYETLLGVDKKYARYGESIIFQELIRSMWPELLDYPINPPYKRVDYVRATLSKIGLISPLKKAVYSMDRVRFNLRRGRPT